MKQTNLKSAWGICFLFLGIAAAAVMFMLDYFGLLPQKSYGAEYFGIETIKSPVDFNGNGTDDYTDILLGAKKDAENKPKYVDKYYKGGYPPENEGVCTDLIWRAFACAGYSLRDMLDCDILQNPQDYPRVSHRDNNIDFRRVPNLKVFFDKYALKLTTDINEISQFQPGDIVIVNGTKHIGIISDKRAKNGVPFILHNGGQAKREENALWRMSITAHYRFDAQNLPDNIKEAAGA